MSLPLTDKKIVLGISGSIAVYKVADWLRSLLKEGGEVNVIMTEAATRFVSPLTFAALSGKKVYSSMFEEENAENIPHISLARDCDLILIAPATAQTIARLAHGLADDLLSAVTLATKAKVVVCPAMNSSMYLHPATQANINKLKEYGYTVVDPASGLMACNEKGPGRLPEWNVIRESILQALAPQDLHGCPVLITAGPTIEPIDSVRFISNRSTGKMGFALARAAHQRGAQVTLITGPSNLPHPPGVHVVSVLTANEMHEAVMTRYDRNRVIVKAAAVSDFRPKTVRSEKIKKAAASLTMTLQPNPDILQELGDRGKESKHPPLLIGFAAESRDHLDEGARKLRDKNLDLIVVNDISATDAGFAVDTNRVTILARNSDASELPLLSKEETAHRIWNRVVKML
ncbi:MAG: bifunctional phosphopantothenoylcysteine decarboxylase/phosphopantothenate--cysteine ligase CoaBC [Desulfobulbaceae bacterium]|nr:bifunctional phosphopantothenoylcysteine decarboxylase/phosphopantothenate--cysteine ligase CoaBC [Desulfobulbaceae bacterium]